MARGKVKVLFVKRGGASASKDGDDDGDDESAGVCAIDIPTHVGAIRVAAVGSFLSGLRAAVSIADSIANNPVLKAVLPPGTGAALDAVNKIANAHATGGPQAAQQAAQQFSGPGGQRLQQAIAQGGDKQGRASQALPPGRFYGLPA